MSTVPFATGPKRSMGHFLGAEKAFFLIRGRRSAVAVAAAAVESCQSVALRSPWGQFGSILYTCNRLHRIRCRFKHFWPISLSRPLGSAIFWPRFAFRAPREHKAAASTAYAVRATTHYQTYPERPPGADLRPKKVCNLGPMAPRSRQKRQLPEGT